MAEKRDYYEVLGISKNASDDEIKRAFRTKAMQYHPDRNKSPDAESKFKEINEAYEVLKDPSKKSMYDKYGHNAPNNQQGGFSSGGFDFSDMFGGDGIDLGDVFGQMFGGQGRRRGNQESAASSVNIEAQINISFVEMCKGVSKNFSMKVKAECPHCHGTGSEDGSFTTCPHCHGTGRIVQRINTPFGTMQNEQTCPYCKGSGKIIKNRCRQCGGTGYVEVSKNYNIDIPCGIDNGGIIRVNGGGNTIKGKTGDLIIHVMINKNRIFERKGNKVYAKILVDPLTAIIGGSIDVPTP
jgi:molecular chaperone DnaJ